MIPASAGLSRPAGTSATTSLRRFVRLLAPEPERAARSREHRRDCSLVQPGMLTGARHGRTGLALPELLRDLPHTPAEYRVPSIDDAHGSPFPGDPTKHPFPIRAACTHEKRRAISFCRARMPMRDGPRPSPADVGPWE